ncbi:MAG: WG repeat-containing protein, partial [Bacillota bacterium]|nr:WG repeat-containing protein [Bacillota bacterium]
MWRSLCILDIVQSFIPPWGELIILEKPYRRAAIEVLDIDGDGLPEVCAYYKWKQEKYILILKNYYGVWYLSANNKLEKSLRIDDQLNAGVVNPYSAKIKTLNGVKWGFIDNKGSFVIKPNFDYAFDFQDNGLAIVGVSDVYGIINTSGNYVVVPKYDFIDQFSEGRAVATSNAKSILIDERGEVLNTRDYDFIGSFKNGRALASGFNEEGKYLYGYLDRQGKEVIPLQYEFASDFVDGKAVVKIKDNEYALIGP